MFSAPLVAGAKVDATVIEHGKATRFASSKCVVVNTIAKPGAIVRGYTEVQFSAIYGADGKELLQPKRPRATNAGVSHGKRRMRLNT